ncbi:LysR family transcriptional regulator [Pseudoalteromonas rubra]|uniref:LysR family transcriptional regulator n=1 Tax=Pseudoalteromonas rubra TaxID=43658 RepID=A0A5S3WK55_9GAMM|nr:LysR family transcriptional regulator [Pseudoalteromonas rubra]TMP27604.1 LysR family transcriptional regulator [Pseudoalteromonas rubra]TMP28913.1 LysR family transcriptional regulator [Pseudoalteromonas rubra]
MDKLRSLTLFLATCEEQSFAAAARVCNTDPSTISKAVSRLEAELGVTLFQRSTRQLKITAAGRHYAHTVRSSIQALSSCEDELRQLNDAPRGRLRVNSAVCYGHLYVRPLLKAFCQRYPEITLELSLDDMHVDIIEQDIDVALRTGFIKDSRLVARCLSPMDFLVCASPDYLEQHGTPGSRGDFDNHAWIGFKIKETQQLQPIFLPDEQGNYQLCDLHRTHITDDGEAMAQLCADGLGFAQLPHFLAKAGLETGALVSLYPAFRAPLPEGGVFAIYPKREYLPARVRVFLDFLVAALAVQQETPTHTWAEHWPARIRFDRSAEQGRTVAL